VGRRVFAAAFLAAFCLACAPSARRREAKPARPADEVIEDLDRARKSLAGFLDYLAPFSGPPAPAGEIAGAVQRQLIAESAACDALFAEGDALLARGLARKKEDSDPSSSSLYLSRLQPALHMDTAALAALAHPSIPELQRKVASEQIDVAGHMATLLKRKRAPVADPKTEAAVQGWLDSSREGLASARKSLAEALQK